MRILILGVHGMLGHRMFLRFRDGFETAGTCRELRAGGIHERILGTNNLIGGVSAEHFPSVARAVAEFRPDAVVNCIGLVKQRPEARDPEPAIRINALFPHRLARLCAERGARLIHFSTDCVFSGKKGNYAAEDPPDAEDLYGRTKFLGELHASHCLTIRSSLVGREIASRFGLVEWFLYTKERPVRGFTRAFFTGLTAAAMAELIEKVIRDHPDFAGVWQVASERISKYDLLLRLDRALGLGREIVPDDSLLCDRSLDGAPFRRATGIGIPSWDAMIAELAAESRIYDRAAAQHG